MLTALSGDNFNTVSLTTSINMLPLLPTRISSSGLFEEKGIPDLQALIENKEGTLSLLPTQPRGARSTQMPNVVVQGRLFRIPHIPANCDVLADSVQGVREFGSEDARAGVASVVTDKLQMMKDSMAATLEYHRLGAIQGNVLDADGTTVIYNLFTEFGISQATLGFDFTPGVQNMKLNCNAIVRSIRLALGAASYKQIRCLCSDSFFDAFVSHPNVAHAYERFQDGVFLRTQQMSGFEFCDIIFENYVGRVGNQDFIPAGDARFYAEGVPGLFQTIYAPANFNETVNTVGKPYYAKQQAMDFDLGWQLHAQSNPLNICTRPGTLIRGFIAAGG